MYFDVGVSIMVMVGHNEGAVGEMTVGSFLRDARMAAGMTQKEVAEGAEIGLSLYKQYEGDRCSPSLENVAKLVDVLNFDPAELLQEVSEPGVASPAPRGRPRASAKFSPVGKSSSPANPVEGVQAELEAIAALREKGGLSELRSRKRVRRLQADLKGLEPDALYEVADAWGINLEACRDIPLLADLLSIFDDDEEEGERVCGNLADRIIDVALLGVDIRAIADRGLIRLAREFGLMGWADVPLFGGLTDDPEEFQELLSGVRESAWRAAVRGEELSIADRKSYPRRY